MIRYATYRVRIKMRPTYEGRPLKDDVEELEGFVFDLMVAWRMGPGGKYPGEYALIPTDKEGARLFSVYCLTWIASGDVEVMSCAQ